MRADDPRHGSPAGYVAGCRDSCCREARARQTKRRRWLTHRGVPTFHTAEEVAELVRPWRLLGLSDAAILDAAGLDGSHKIRERVTHTTFAALAAITEDDLMPDAFVLADLTRCRAYSLMAAGHPLDGMPLPRTGRWRKSERVTVATARAMREHYAAHEFKLGPSRQIQSRTRNAGHLPPLAWDDPGTLAWPTGQPPRIIAAPRRNPDDIDEAVVDRLLAGIRVPSTAAEKREALRRWIERGGSERALCERHGWKQGRYKDRTEEAA